MTIHIFNNFHNPYGGSELEALALHELLGRTRKTRLWATSSRASPDLLTRFPIERVSLANRPDGGTS